MTPPQLDIASIVELVKTTAQSEIMSRFNKVGFDIKADGSLLTEADLAANARIQEALYAAYPSIAFLSEEMTTEEQQQQLDGSEWLWCLDPLDGTSNFATGVPLFASSLALFHQGQVVLGISYDPNRDEMFVAQKGQGASLNGQSLNIPPKQGIELNQAIAIFDYKRLPAKLRAHVMQQPPYRSQRNLGSCVLEWCWAAAQRGHFYVHGGMHLWDLAAGVLILEEAGGYSQSFDGSPVINGTLDTRSVIAAVDEHMFNAVCDYIKHAQ